MFRPFFSRRINSVIGGLEEAKNPSGQKCPPPDSDLFYWETSFTKTIRICLARQCLIFYVGPCLTCGIYLLRQGYGL